jgi:hypothetical protein
MKPVRCLGLAVLLSTPLFASWPNTVSLKPLFVPDKLIFALDGGPESADQSVLEAIYANAGVEEVQQLSFDPGAVVRLKSGVKLGRAFRAIQTFSFIGSPEWSLRYVEVGHFAFIPEAYPPIASRVFNFSARAEVGAGDSVTIGGIVVPGDFPRLVVFKVRGASLADFNVEGTLANPRMTLFEGDTPVLSNDDWTTLREWEKTLASQLCPPPDDEREAMIVTYLDPGAYTAIVCAPEGESGVVLLEMYLEDAFMVQ